MVTQWFQLHWFQFAMVGRSLSPPGPLPSIYYHPLLSLLCPTCFSCCHTPFLLLFPSVSVQILPSLAPPFWILKVFSIRVVAMVSVTPCSAPDCTCKRKEREKSDLFHCMATCLNHPERRTPANLWPKWQTGAFFMSRCSRLIPEPSAGRVDLKD